MLLFSIPKLELGVWMPILGNGIGFPIKPNTPLNTFLCEEITIQPEYLKHRIQTILVNGQAIDEVNNVYLADGDVVALSAAMPGLVGTTLRKGSHLAEMRRTITHHDQTAPIATGRQGVVTLKLFNLVAREIGPTILEGPILLKRQDLAHLASYYPEIPTSNCSVQNEDWIQLRISHHPLDIAPS